VIDCASPAGTRHFTVIPTGKESIQEPSAVALQSACHELKDQAIKGWSAEWNVAWWVSGSAVLEALHYLGVRSPRLEVAARRDKPHERRGALARNGLLPVILHRS
jgi:hypothetical protein